MLYWCDDDDFYLFLQKQKIGAELHSLMTGPDPSSLVKQRGGGEKEVTRVTVRSRLSIVAGDSL